jgi:hypothetical protein
MAIKIFCDMCGKPAENPEFLFSGEIKDVVVNINPADMIAPQKTMRHRLIQICKECFEQHIQPKFHAEEKETTK